MKLYVRDDDVLISSSGFTNVVTRLKQVQSWFAQDFTKLVHVPNILVSEIQEFPEAIEFVREETRLGHMEPQLHGFRHIDYAKLPINEIRDHLSRSKDWMTENLGVTPTKFYTPWGANAPHIFAAAAQESMTVVDCSAIEKPGQILTALRRDYPLEYMEGKEVFFHWWQRGRNLERVMACYIHGGYRQAVAYDPGMFKD